MISVIVAVFNGAETLQRCIDSVSQQDYPHIQLIIMDGCSTDSTLEIIQKNDSTIDYWESSPDKGIYDAWNKALKHAHGEWIFFLGADDYFWNSTATQSMLQYLEKAETEGTRVVYGQVSLVDNDENLIMVAGKPWPEIRNQFLHEMCIPHQGTFHHAMLFKTKGLFCDTFKIAGDYDLLLREVVYNEPLYAPVMIAGMQIGGICSKPENRFAVIKEFTLARRKNRLSAFSHVLFWRYCRAKLRSLLSICFGNRSADKAADMYRRVMGGPIVWNR